MFYVVSLFENVALERQVWADQPNDDAVIERTSALMEAAPHITMATITAIDSLADYRDVAIITSRPVLGDQQDDALDN